jgi:hypothetical protein
MLWINRMLESMCMQDSEELNIRITNSFKIKSRWSRTAFAQKYGRYVDVLCACVDNHFLAEVPALGLKLWLSSSLSHKIPRHHPQFGFGLLIEVHAANVHEVNESTYSFPQFNIPRPNTYLRTPLHIPSIPSPQSILKSDFTSDKESLLSPTYYSKHIIKHPSYFHLPQLLFAQRPHPNTILYHQHPSQTDTTQKLHTMSDAYERERQNNSRLEELSAKVTALRGVTVDIYDNARAQDVIDNTVCHASPPFILPPCCALLE